MLEKALTLSRSDGRWTIELSAVAMGPDLCVLLGGGSRYHLGALAYGSPEIQPGTFTFPAHKETLVVQQVAARLRQAFRGHFLIGCGIHLDDISQAEIETALELCSQLTDELIAGLSTLFPEP